MDRNDRFTAKISGIVQPGNDTALLTKVFIGLLGITNTLTLNVIERHQEIGMLRAIGVYKRQIQSMIRLESIQISLYGAAIGVVLGVGIGWAFLRVLENEGISEQIIPWELTGWICVGAIIVGAFAVIIPGRRAAKIPPLEAIAD